VFMAGCGCINPTAADDVGFAKEASAAGEDGYGEPPELAGICDDTTGL